MACACTHDHAMVLNMTWKREVLATGDKVKHAKDRKGVGTVIRVRFNGYEVRWPDGSIDDGLTLDDLVRVPDDK
jgi:hypothetical protein